MRNKIIAIFLSILLLPIILCACSADQAKAAYKPPAEIFDVKISGTSEPHIDGVKFTYDSQARIDTVSFTLDGYEYKQEYSYDSEQIVIKTIYKTEVIEEKVIKYVEIPKTSGFTTIDGYYIRVIDDMASGNNGENNSAKKPTEKQTEKQPDNSTSSSSNERILSEYINKSRGDLVSECGNGYSSVEMPGAGMTDCIMFDSLSDVVFGISAETNRVIVIYCGNSDLYLVKGLKCNMTISELKSLDPGDYSTEEYDLEMDGTHNYVLQYSDGFRVSFTWNGDYVDTLADMAVIQNVNYLR